MTSQPGKQTIAMQILHNISRSKHNQTMKFSQLIEYNVRNIFLEKSYTKYSGKTIPRPTSKKPVLGISLFYYLSFFIHLKSLKKNSSILS